jgi:hypothetical protein
MSAQSELAAMEYLSKLRPWHYWLEKDFKKLMFKLWVKNICYCTDNEHGCGCPGEIVLHEVKLWRR